MTTEPKTCDVTVEIEHIRDGIRAHQRGHDWLRFGEPDVALDYFRLGSRHGLAAAEEDAAALDGSGRAAVADCPIDSPPARHRAGRRRTWLVPAAATLLALIANLFLHGWLERPPSAPAPAPAQYVGMMQLPTALPDGKAGSRVDLDLGSDATPRAVPAPASAAPSPGHVTTTPARPPAPPSTPASGPAPSSDPHFSFSREGGAEPFTALVFTDDTDRWRRLRLEATPGSEFQATLWSIGHQPCRWRFVGLDSTGPDATETTTGEIRVAAGERRYTTLFLRDWPILSVEVRGGEQAAGCLLVNQRIVPASPSPSVSPSADRTEATPSPRPSSPAETIPTPERTVDPAAQPAEAGPTPERTVDPAAQPD